LRRPGRLLIALVAALCAVTLAAGLTVARLLPGRLSLWRRPGIEAVRPAGPGEVLGAASGTVPAGVAATKAGVAAALAPLLSASVFGPQLGVLVTTLPAGKVLYSSNPSAGFAPASTNKLATSVAALQVLGPNARFSTTVVTGHAAGSVVLVGGGDPTLAAGALPASAYPQPANLQQLARRTAQALRARGERSVTLGYDTSLYTGPGLLPGWSGYVSSGNVSTITPLEVDEGRITPSGAPADNLSGGGPRSSDPAALAASSFAGFLTADGIHVRGAASLVTAPGGATRLASVQSPPLTQIIQLMLEESNNVIAENLARHVALATGHPASFSGGAAAVTSVLRSLGVTGEVSLHDGSGLSPDDRLAPAVLVQLVRLAASRSRFRPVLTGLPVEGFSGTLGLGGSVFGLGPPAGFGVVRAKTGNLTTVAALAGTAYARNGQLFAFAVMADQISAAPGALERAATQMVDLAGALAGCGCR
jgi:serine-type D-Ala-D-Ala carboxypeptidase/endopeptidase (penicillin-binding protein 4)